MGVTHAPKYQRGPMQKKIKKKIKMKPSGGQTHAPKYYLQLINCKQHELDLRKTQKKIKKKI